MGDDELRKCERSAATEVGNIGEGGIMKTRASEAELSSFSNKKRKVDDSEAPHHPELQLNSVSASSATSTCTTATTSSASDVEKENIRWTDLKLKDSETEISTSKIGQFRIYLFGSSRETSPSSEVCGGESGGEFMEYSSSTTTTTTRKTKNKSSMPSAAEIEEFFSAAEKQEQTRFAEKYNYDIVKDVPLEGRYQWIPMKP